jgi:penicillin-binding protein 2
MTQIDQNRSRTWVIQGIMAAIFLLFIIRLLVLQVINKDYAELAKDRTVRKVTIYPDRGQMYDRNGLLVVHNKPIYNLMVIPSQVRDLDTTKFCQLLGVDRSYFDQKMAAARRYSPLHASIFLPQIEGKDFAHMEEYMYQFRGFFPEIRTERSYPFPSAAHLFGYVTEVDSGDINRSDGYYKSGDYIGKSGIEKSYEEILRGKKGYKYMVVDAHNRLVGSLAGGEKDEPAEAGKNVTISIDIKLQQFAEKLMQGKKGAVVAIEPSTGEVLCLVSSPYYDPNLLSGSSRNKNFAALITDPNRPLNNRALTGYYPPGSQFKAVLALIGLQEGTLTENQGYSCNGGYRMSGHTVGCHNHVLPANVVMGIQHSCNAYFCYVLKHFIDDHNERAADGLVKLKKYLASFGIGIPTGIDLPGEKGGNVPDPEDYNKIYGENRWKSSNFITLGIGQDQMIVTPLQNANMMASIANGGYYISPHVFKNASDEDSLINALSKHHVTMVDPAYFEIVTEGLSMVVKAGTARVARIDSIEVCGKTGTAENPHGKDHSQFSGFAPRNNPQIAVAVLVENSGFGATWAAPIASLVMEYYLTGGISDNRTYLLDRMVNANLTGEVKADLPKKNTEVIDPDVLINDTSRVGQ